MSQHIVARCRGVAALLLMLALGPSIAGEPAATPYPSLHHAVMKPHQNADGSLAASSSTMQFSENWSGYQLDAVTGNPGPYSSAKGSWLVPGVSYAAAPNNPPTEASSTWVGIGGNCFDTGCTSGDPTLIQIGTESDAHSDGTFNYYVWYEMLPATQQFATDANGNRLPVSPGDAVTASVQCVALCTPGATQTWQFNMVNQTKGWTFTKTVSYASSMDSAEWIVEATTSASHQVEPLADFGVASFNLISANGINPSLDPFVNGITLLDPLSPTMPQVDQTAVPSPPVEGEAFSVCWFDGDDPFGSCSFSGQPPSAAALVAAVLPSSRSVVVGTTATVFATIINPSPTPGDACTIQPISSVDGFIGSFFFQTTDPSTNLPTGTLNAPVNIPANGSQSFLLGLTPSVTTPGSTNVEFTYLCQGEPPAAAIFGVNTLAFSVSGTPVPDVIAEVATVTNDGTLHIPGATATGAFAMATANLGAAGPLTVTANTGSAALPLTITVCETVPGAGSCMAPPAASVPVTIGAGAEPTFSIFATAEGNVPFNPATTRIFVQFTDGTGTVRGSSSVAVTTN